MTPEYMLSYASEFRFPDGSRIHNSISPRSPYKWKVDIACGDGTYNIIKCYTLEEAFNVWENRKRYRD